jgi:type VI secretion system protein ImpJ
MKERQKVVWFEGMSLDPHHFQQWDRHRRHAVEARVRAALPCSWGLTALDVDQERLRGGEFALARCTGVFPDGRVVNVPGDSRRPPPRSLVGRDLAVGTSVAVALSVPPARRGDLGGAVPRPAVDEPAFEGPPFYDTPVPDAHVAGAPEAGTSEAGTSEAGTSEAGATGAGATDAGVPDGEAPYALEVARPADSTTGGDPRPIHVARLNVRLLVGKEVEAASHVLPLARVERTADGAFRLDPTYAPPCLRVGASERLRSVVRSLADQVRERLGALRGRAAAARGRTALSLADAVALGLCAELGGALPLLRHVEARGDAHPEVLFQGLASLVGRLEAYVDPAGLPPADVPAYDHTRPADSLNALAARLKELVRRATPREEYREIPLRRRDETLHVAALTADEVGRTRLVLALREPEGRPRSAERWAATLRVSCPATIGDVLSSYTRGVPLEPADRRPAGLPREADARYLLVRKSGPFWDAIVRAKSLAVFAPQDAGSGVEVSLYALPDRAGLPTEAAPAASGRAPSDPPSSDGLLA